MTAAPQPSPEQDRAISVLVGLALDDLESGNLDVETALYTSRTVPGPRGSAKVRTRAVADPTELPDGDETHLLLAPVSARRRHVWGLRAPGPVRSS
jgi:hypothetical protein